jgi:hypothetical protein
MALTVSWRDEFQDERKMLDTGGWLIAPFRATFTGDDLEIELMLDVIDGAPACTSYTVRSTGGSGLENRTTEAVRGRPLRQLMVDALSMSVWEQYDDEGGLASTVELVEAVMGSVRRTRKPVDDERLEQVADAYRKHWVPGGAAEFAESLNCSERQMWRLIKLARERGLLEEN